MLPHKRRCGTLRTQTKHLLMETELTATEINSSKKFAYSQGPTGSSAAGPSSAANGPPQAKRRRTAGKTVPKTFGLQAATLFLPCVLGCTLFGSATEGRIRAFYTVGTSRRSTSASIVNYGPSQAITWCLKWAWQTHSEHTGESCPWPELLERVCEPLS